MNGHFINAICKATGASSLYEVEEIQSLWSGYGKILRIGLVDSKYKSVVVKHIQFGKTGSHPRGWDTLWKQGTYWHLSTRPEELAKMLDSPLKQHASHIDEKLDECSFKTIVHGDAKLANFCFTKSGTKSAAVDFQYVGGGCGMKDVAYF